MRGSRALLRRAKRGVFELATRLNVLVVRIYATLRPVGDAPTISDTDVAVAFHLTPQDRVLVLAPHPDDEALGLGGTMAALHDAGVAITVMLMTDGRKSGAGALATMTPAERGNLRFAEFSASIAQLGQNIAAIGPFCAELDGHDDARDQTAEAKMLDAALALAPKVIFCPPPFDYHPDHRAAARLGMAISRAVAPNQSDTALYYYEIQAPFSRETPKTFIALAKPYWNRKRAAIACHQTQSATAQNGLRLSRYRRAFLRGHAHVEVFVKADDMPRSGRMGRGFGHNPLHDLPMLFRR